MIDFHSSNLLRSIVIGLLHAMTFFFVALFPTYQMATFQAESTVHYTFLFLLAVILGFYWLASTEARLPAAGLGMLGALLGFLIRPSAPEVGQLPFSAIIMIPRGAGATSPFSEPDPVLIAVAQSSFNMVMAGAILGLAVAFGLSVLAARRRRGEA